jgi:hypothetical protein
VYIVAPCRTCFAWHSSEVECAPTFCTALSCLAVPPICSGDTVATGAFAIAWNSFVAFWTFSAVAGGGLLFGLFSLPFWAAGIQLAKQAFGRQFIR